MKSGDYIDLQLVIILICFVLMLAVFIIERGSNFMRLMIFTAALGNAILAVFFIKREQRLIRRRQNAIRNVPSPHPTAA